MHALRDTGDEVEAAHTSYVAASAVRVQMTQMSKECDSEHSWWSSMRTTAGAVRPTHTTVVKLSNPRRKYKHSADVCTGEDNVEALRPVGTVC